MGFLDKQLLGEGGRREQWGLPQRLWVWAYLPSWGPGGRPHSAGWLIGCKHQGLFLDGGGGTDIFTQDFLYIGEKVAEFLEIALGTGLFTSFICLFVCFEINPYFS